MQPVFMAIFVVPILFCLIGAGAFLHLILVSASPVAGQEDSGPNREDELVALRRKVAELEAIIRQLQALRAEGAEREKERQDLAKKLSEAEELHRRFAAERDRAREEAQQAHKTYSVTALNAGGVQRDRPALFAECQAGGITLQPGGKVLGIRMETGEQQSFLSLAKQAGHVVFLIRPDGFDSFYRYRSLLMSENRRSTRPVEMGFEPVDADWILKYPGKEG